MTDWDSPKQTREPDPECEVGFVLPSMIPPLMDVTLESVVYIWARLVVDGGRLTVEQYNTRFFDGGGRPPWWTEERVDLDYLLFGSFLGDQGTPWGLEEGICPGQPFLIAIPEPHCSRDYWGEYDEDWSYDIVKTMPRKPEASAVAWDRALARMKLSKAETWRKAGENTARAVRSHNTWALQESTYFNGPHDGARLPDTIRLTLVSNPGTPGPFQMASGEAKIDDPKAAFQQLMGRFTQSYPEANHAKARELFETRYGVKART